MLLITLLESVDGIVTSDGEDVEVSEGCKGAEDVSVRGVFPFPPNPRAIVTVVSIFACCLAEEKWNKALIEADENLISRLNIFDVSILKFANVMIMMMIMIILDAMKVAWRQERKLV